MSQRVLVVVPALIGAALVAGGCATKSFVREEVQKSQAQVEQKLDQQVGRLDGNLTQEKARISGVAVQVTETRTVADEATRRADQAAGKAGEAATRADGATAQAGEALAKAAEASGLASQAMAKAEQTDQRLTRLWANRNKRNLGDTLIVLFGFDKWQLDDRAETALLDVVKQLQENPNLVVDLEGYTDNVGPPPYNIQLSQRRSEAVRRFLVQKGIDLHRIQSIGLADIRPVADNTSSRGRDQNRRVAVKVFVPAE